MTENVRKFEKALEENEVLRRQFEEELKRIAGAKEAESDAEAIAKAATALGYDFTAADYEKASAETQELDADEMAATSGGERETCVFDYACYLALKHNTDRQNQNEACARDYTCQFIYHKGFFMLKRGCEYNNPSAYDPD